MNIMKKNYLKLMAYLFAAIVCVGFVSCGDDDDDDSAGGTETPEKPVEPTEDNAMSSADQKEYLEQVALEFMDQMPASDFRDIADLAMFVEENYGRDYDWDNVEDWVEDAFDAAREALGTKTTDKKSETYDSYTYKYNYIYTNYKALLLASNFTGHFTARNGRWVYSDVDDLQFIFTDKRGQQCVLKLETSGNVKKVHVLNDDHRTDSEYSSSGNTYTYNKYYDRTQYTIGVPEQIDVTLTQGGSQVVKTTVKIDLSSITSEEFDISKNSLTVSAVVELNNGYKFNVSKVVYTANTSVSVAFTMTKNGTALLTMDVSGNVKDVPSVNVSEFSSKNFDTDDYDFDKINGKNCQVKLDILGKVQIKGSLADVRKYLDYLDAAKDNRTSESTFKSYINQANSLADINLFYDGKNVKQAAIRLESFAEENWDGRTYWEAEPIIYFYDGSTYSTLEAFFNEKEFKTVIESFKDLANKYADLVDERIDW